MACHVPSHPHVVQLAPGGFDFKEVDCTRFPGTRQDAGDQDPILLYIGLSIPLSLSDADRQKGCILTYLRLYCPAARVREWSAQTSVPPQNIPQVYHKRRASHSLDFKAIIISCNGMDIPDKHGGLIRRSPSAVPAAHPVRQSCYCSRYLMHHIGFMDSCLRPQRIQLNHGRICGARKM